MASKYEQFWTHNIYVVIGNNAKAPFPALTFSALLSNEGKKVFAVDASVAEIKGQKTYPDLDSVKAALEDGLSVDAAVLEVPKKETRDWIEKIADEGIKNVWIHGGRETPEALELAAERGLHVCYGTCAVQYLDSGFPHNFHAWIRRMMGNF